MPSNLNIVIQLSDEVQIRYIKESEVLRRAMEPVELIKRVSLWLFVVLLIFNIDDSEINQ